MLDLITIGDSTIDTHIKIHDGELVVSKDNKEPKFCIPWGTKIPVDALQHEIGGNAVNVAVGTTRLGLNTAIYTNVGGDDSGKRIVKKLKEEKVESDFVNVEVGMQSNYAAVLSFQGERTIFTYHQKWDYDLPDLPKTKWLYLTSCGEGFTKGDFISDLATYIVANNVKLAYNPGTYQLKADIKSYPELLKVCNLLIVNQEEAGRILEINRTSEMAMKRLLTGLRNLGPKKVIITAGASGSFSYDGVRSYFLQKVTAPTIQAVGAGDAYSSGLLSALVHGHEFPDAMVWGALNSASVVSKVGAHGGLLTEYELLKQQSTLAHFKAVEF